MAQRHGVAASITVPAALVCSRSVAAATTMPTRSTDQTR